MPCSPSAVAMTFSAVIATSGSKPRRKQSGRKMPTRAALGSAQLPGPGVARPMLCLTAMLWLLCGSTSPALAAGATFELAQVLDVLKKEIAAADAPADDGRPVRVDEAQVDLDLVEIMGKAGARLVVPGSDFGGKENPPKPVLKRRVVIDIVGARDAKTTEPTAAGEGTGSRTRASPESGLARAIDRVKAAVRTGVEAPYEFRRIAIDLEFVLERNAKGAPEIVIFAGDRRIEAKNVQKLRLKLSAKDR